MTKKRCRPLRTTGYFCKRREACDELATRGRAAGFATAVKAPLPPRQGPPPAWETAAMRRAAKPHEGLWHVELAYPLKPAGIARDAEVAILAKGTHGLEWYFSEVGPFCRK